MTNTTGHGVRRYSDLLTTGYMKTGADGRKIFYPWGMLGNGYIFPSNDAYERLNDLLKVYMVVTLAFILPPAVAGSNFATTTLILLALAFYWIWMRFELPGLQPTQEKLTVRVGLTNFARLLPGWLVWAELIICIVFVASSLLMLMTSPGQWMFALGGILLFGAGLVLSATTLVLRRRLAREQC